MIIMGAIFAMLGIVWTFMAAALIFFIWRLTVANTGSEYHLTDIAKYMKEELEEMRAQARPQVMMLPRGVLPEGLLKKESTDAKDSGGGRYL